MQKKDDILVKYWPIIAIIAAWLISWGVTTQKVEQNIELTRHNKQAIQELDGKIDEILMGGHTYSRNWEGQKDER